MGQSTKETADRRAHTDASLGAERATFDADSLVPAAEARSLLDDLIERDRILADLRLLKFRDRIDRTLSRQRSDSLAPDSAVFSERIAADHRSQAEREMGDELLQRERDRSDVAVATERTEQQTRRGTLDTRRLDTDDQLSTERRGADRTLVATTNALAEAKTQGERRHDVLGVVAHDLRSPLTVISMSADNVAELSRDPVIRISCHAITLAVARMERLLSDLLDLARIDSGTLRIVKRQHDIGTLLAEIHGSYEPLFTARHIAFVIDVPTERVLACFDHDRIVQVLSNLLGNAMKFTPSGGTVTLRTELQEGQILFTVSDSGPGIPAAIVDDLFEPFRQIDSLTRRGLGLGLHICKNIVQAHGGSIWAPDDVGHGATLRFTLPLV